MASESRNLAQQRREKDGIVYFERGILTGRDGRRYQRYAIQTHFVEVGESAAELVKKYVLPLAQPGDVLSITAKVMAMCTGNVRRMEPLISAQLFPDIFLVMPFEVERIERIQKIHQRRPGRKGRNLLIMVFVG